MLLAIASVVFASKLSQEQTAPEWKTIQTVIGATISLPADMPLFSEVPMGATAPPPPASKDAKATKADTGKTAKVEAVKVASETPPAPETVGSETYWSADRKCGVAITRSDFSKDEDKDDTDAIKLEDVVYDLIEPADDSVTMIHFTAREGWPSVDLDVTAKKGGKITLGGVEFDVRPDMGTVRYRVFRAKTKNYLIQIYGPLSKEDRGKILDSFKLPKDAGEGKLTKWGPEAKKQYLNESRIEVWSPFEFKEDEDSDAEAGAMGKAFEAEFGYERLSIAAVPIPDEAADQLTEAVLDQVVKSASTRDDDDEDKAEIGEIKGYTSNLVNYRYATGKSGSQDIRIDVAIENKTLFIFYIYVQHGLLESDDIKKFIASYSVH